MGAYFDFPVVSIPCLVFFLGTVADFLWHRFIGLLRFCFYYVCLVHLRSLADMLVRFICALSDVRDCFFFTPYPLLPPFEGREIFFH